MKNKKIICSIGEILIDAYEIENEQKFEVAGASFNAAASLQKLGNDVIFLGAIGNDDHAKNMLEKFTFYGMDSKYLQIVQKESTIAKVVLDKNNDRNFIFSRGADKEFDLDLKVIDKKIDFMHFGSATAFLGGKLEESYFKLLDYCLKNNIAYSFDPNYRDNLINNEQILKDYREKCLTFFKTALFVKFSTEEANILANLNNIQESLEYFAKINPSALICVTQGQDDTLFYWKGKIYNVEIIKSQNVADTTGAGDAFVSGMINYLIKNDFSQDSGFEEIKEITKLANDFASKSVEYLGALTFLNHI